jgi:hypothetical protein
MDAAPPTIGSVAPGRIGGHRKRVLEPHRDFIIERITQTPHLTLHRLTRSRSATWSTLPVPSTGGHSTVMTLFGTMNSEMRTP